MPKVVVYFRVTDADDITLLECEITRKKFTTVNVPLQKSLQPQQNFISASNVSNINYEENSLSDRHF